MIKKGFLFALGMGIFHMVSGAASLVVLGLLKDKLADLNSEVVEQEKATVMDGGEKDDATPLF